MSPSRAVQPELQYNPKLRNGIAVCSFDIWLDSEAMVVHEWRSGLGNRRVGPRLVFQPDRLLVGAGDTLLRPAPSSEWIHVEVECGLGAHARVPAVYKVTLTYAGQIPEPYDDLACAYRRFRALDQCVFLGARDEETSHSIDNVRIAIK